MAPSRWQEPGHVLSKHFPQPEVVDVALLPTLQVGTPGSKRSWDWPTAPQL